MSDYVCGGAILWQQCQCDCEWSCTWSPAWYAIFLSQLRKDYISMSGTVIIKQIEEINYCFKGWIMSCLDIMQHQLKDCKTLLSFDMQCARECCRQIEHMLWIVSWLVNCKVIMWSNDGAHWHGHSCGDMPFKSIVLRGMLMTNELPTWPYWIRWVG